MWIYGLGAKIQYLIGRVGEVVDVRRERFFFVNPEVINHFDNFYMI